MIRSKRRPAITPEGQPIETQDDDPLMLIDPLDSFDPELTSTALAKVRLSEEVDVSDDDASAEDLSQIRFATLNEDELSRLTELRHEFESAWEDGDKEPIVEQFVPTDVDTDLRQMLVSELVLLDIEQRRKRNKSLPASEYRTRLSAYSDAVESALQRTKSLVPQASSTDSTTESNVRPQPLSRHAHDPTTRYRPAEMHARGGLGAVYRARDEELNRLVALKEILPKHSSEPRFQEKFIFEAQVTGSLEHPGIVPVYGLGRYEDNQPYYAMRFIHGRSLRGIIAEFHEKNPKPSSGTYLNRDFRVLLRRLIETCNAIHYAHEHGVLHRDIKPDNIMLGDYGETLVVDWGLAMVVDSKHVPSDAADGSNIIGVLGSTAANATRQGIAGTPMYMSPEQAHGHNDQLDSRSDVYSLGMVLFNLVTGGHAIEGNSTPDVLKNVRQGNTKTITELLPAAPRALASICRKAMALDPNDRYSTAVEFGDDIDRWMSVEAVDAHSESLFEKAARLLSRYRTQALTGAVAMMLITVVSVISAVLIYQAKRNEETAKLRAKEFKNEAVDRYRDSRQAIDSWLVESSDALKYFPGMQSVRSRLLTLAAEDYEKLGNAASEDPDLELERGRALIRLGDLKQTQKEYPAAQKHYEDAIGLLTQILSKTPDHDSIQKNLYLIYAAEAANARSRLALNLASNSQPEAADREYLKAIDELKPLTKTDVAAMANRYLGAALVNWGEAARSQNQFPEATQRVLEATAAFDRLGDRAIQDDHLMRYRADEMLGRIAADQGKHAEAIAILDEAIERVELLVNAAADEPTYLDASASLLVSRARAHRSLGQYKLGIESLSIAIERYHALRKALPSVPHYRDGLALALTNLGLVLYDLERCRDAKQYLEDGKELYDGWFSIRQGNEEFTANRAACYDALGQVQLALGEPTLAKELLIEAIKAYQELPDHPAYNERFAIAQSHGAQVLAADPSATEETLDSSRQLFEAAITNLQEELIDKFPNKPSYRSAIAHVYEKQGRFFAANQSGAALESFVNARNTWIDLDENRSPFASHSLAWLLITCNIPEVLNFTEAIRHASDAVAATPDNSLFRCTLGLAYLFDGNLAEAATNLSRIIENDENERTGCEWFTLAVLHRKQGNDELADRALAQARQWYGDQAPHHPDLRIWESLVNSKPHSQNRN